MGYLLCAGKSYKYFASYESNEMEKPLGLLGSFSMHRRKYTLYEVEANKMFTENNKKIENSETIPNG